MLLPAFTRRNTAHHVGPIADHVFSMKRTDFSRETLDNDARGFVNQNSHLNSLDFFCNSLIARLNNFLGGFRQRSGHNDGQAAFMNDAATVLDVCS